MSITTGSSKMAKAPLLQQEGLVAKDVEVLQVRDREDDRVTFTWALDSEEATTVSTSLRQSSSDQLSILNAPMHFLAGPEPALILTGIALVTALVRQSVDWWDRRKKPGLLIHLRKTGDLDVRQIDVPYGTILFVTPDGKRLEVQSTSKDQLEGLLLEAVGRLPDRRNSPEK